MSIKTKLSEILKKSLKKANINIDFEINIDKPSKIENGDYSSNIALILSKTLHKDSCAWIY